MKNLVVVLAVALGSLFSVNAQDMKMGKTISLEQTKGEFTQKQITVDEGTYTFEIANNAVGHDVGFVLVKKGQDITKPENHIQTAYVTKAVGTGLKQTSKPTALTKGEYVYFCPLNPTSTDNILTVK
ncbi:plastocyanin/azurin family copper-binding protein [Cellulophaga baltica]|uniref:Copper binding protein, plastocyanin/azurin family n=1 Tax=Cellulophaga baltica TaxID=76594 RepID=A0A1G7F8Z9_9FLAO|nr:plastocyanin/azurin family copper-binding protein [Cellulophaga baltica]SDE72377.1 Copper binding protein, plastocyanin/azurin family [Cellulophaga baltica]